MALLYVAAFGAHRFGADASLDLLLVLSGLVTAAPLLMFAASTKRLRYATVGLLQYVAPTIQFLLAVLLYREPLTGAHIATFALIWAGLIVYATDSLAAARRANSAGTEIVILTKVRIHEHGLRERPLAVFMDPGQARDDESGEAEPVRTGPRRLRRLRPLRDISRANVRARRPPAARARLRPRPTAA